MLRGLCLQSRRTRKVNLLHEETRQRKIIQLMDSGFFFVNIWQDVLAIVCSANLIKSCIFHLHFPHMDWPWISWKTILKFAIFSYFNGEVSHPGLTFLHLLRNSIIFPGERSTSSPDLSLTQAKIYLNLSLPQRS